MGSLSRRRKAKWDLMMKSSIAEAAISVLNEHGIDGLSMDRVAEAAEVAKGTLYNYFKNKDELLLNAMEIKFEGIHQEFLKIQNGNSSPPEKIEKIIRTLLFFFQDERALQVVVNATEGFSLPVKSNAESKREILIKIIAEILNEGMKQKFFQKYNALLAAKLLYGAFNNFYRIKLSCENDPQPYEGSGSDFIKIFFSGLLLKD